MPASDVPAWAKTANKPSYTASEVGASPSNHNHDADYQPLGDYADASHTHDAADITPDSTHRFFRISYEPMCRIRSHITSCMIM